MEFFFRQLAFMVGMTLALTLWNVDGLLADVFSVVGLVVAFFGVYRDRQRGT